MSSFPRQIDNFIEEFSQLPSIGPRMARRLAFYLVNLDDQTFNNLKKAFIGLDNIDRCPRCFFIKGVEQDVCSICSDSDRDHSMVAIVEKETDLLSLENTGKFEGDYLIIGESGGGGGLSKSQNLRLKELTKRAANQKKERLSEVILATSPNTAGDLLAGLIRDKIKDTANKITRLGMGLPTGSEVEFADPQTLSQALQSRK